MQTCHFSRILHFSIHQLLNHSEKIFAIYTIIYSSKINISLVPFPIPWIVHLHQHVPIFVYVKGIYASIESRIELWICFHCVKSVLIRNFSGPYFPTFRLNTERYSVTHPIQFEYVEIWTRETPNTDIFNAMGVILFLDKSLVIESHVVTKVLETLPSLTLQQPRQNKSQNRCWKLRFALTVLGIAQRQSLADVFQSRCS